MVAAIGAVAAVGGSLISANAAGNAADTQAGATRDANAEAARQYDNNVALQAPAINTGNTARDRLSYLLGLSPTGFSNTTSVGGIGNPSATQGTGGQTYDQLRQQLLSQYTTNPAIAQSPGAPGLNLPQGASGNGIDQYTDGANVPGWYDGRNPQQSSVVDEQGLEAAIQARLAEQRSAQDAALAAAQADPNYGRLAQQYTPEKFSYTGQDLYDDPSYQFRLSQGQKAVDRAGAAAGRFLSGSQLQATSNYNQNAASQEYGAAHNRALGAFTVNEGNRFNAYQSNFNNAVNPLLALSGAATLGSQNLGAAGMATGAQIGNNLTNQANATGAAGIAGANAISNGLTGAVQGYQTNQLVNSLANRGVNNNPSVLAAANASTDPIYSMYSANSTWR